jgi:hypothetical protein
MTQDSSRTPWNRGLIGAWVGSFLVVVGVVVAMRFEGRVWCCDCDSPWTVWKGDVWTSHCSQHVLDPYSFTHFTHGLIFCVVLGWVAKLLDKWGASRATASLPSEAVPGDTRAEHGLSRKPSRGTWTFPVHWRFFASVLLASAWEVAENSPFVINRYRAATMSLDYLGDSVTNAVADVVCCGVGFWVSRRIGVRMSMALLVAIEIGLLVTTRDNLTLNVLMLVSPVESVKAWQMGGR